MRGIYIKTLMAGRGGEIVTEFAGKADLYRYVCEVRADAELSPSMNIEQLCIALEDCGPGTGQRTHRRISAEDAKRLERN